MGWITEREQVLTWVKKYRYILAVILVGMLFLTLPSDPEPESPVTPEIPNTDSNPDLQTSLSEILSSISGAGKVRVLLTQSAGEEIIYQLDQDISHDGSHQDTVIITNSDREEVGLVRQVIPPAYLGAIVICQGADSANVRLSIVEAVMSVTGLSSDRITVLKMK